MADGLASSGLMLHGNKQDGLAWLGKQWPEAVGSKLAK